MGNRTVGSILTEIDELKQKLAIKKALAGFLRTRYLSRDGLAPQSTIAYERSVVTEDVIIEVLSDMETLIETEEKQLMATLKENISE